MPVNSSPAGGSSARHHHQQQQQEASAGAPLRPRLADHQPRPPAPPPAAEHHEALGCLDGGVRGWLVVLGSFLMHAVGLGMLYSNGVFLLPYVEHFGVGRGAMAWFATLSQVSWFLSGPLLGRLGDKVGVRVTSSIATVGFSSCLLLASIAPNVWAVFAFHGVGLGLCLALLYNAGVSVVSHWFHTRRGLATGVAAAGSGIGNFVFAPGLQALIDAHGWRYALRVGACVGGGLLALSTLLLKRRFQVERVGGMEWGMFHNRNFRLIAVAVGLLNVGYFVPFVFVTAFAVDHGMSAEQGSFVLSLIGMSSAVGRVFVGGLSDRIGRLRTLTTCFFIVALDIMVWPACTNLAALIAFGIVYGMAAGSFIATLPVVVGDVFGVQRLSGFMGLLLFGNAFGVVVGSPLVGWVYDETGEYLWGAEAVGAVCLVSAVCLAMVRPCDDDRMWSSMRLSSKNLVAGNAAPSAHVEMSPVEAASALQLSNADDPGVVAP